AGLLVGPEVSFFPSVQENDAIKVWAEIGVIVLLFGLGLEFSFKKLTRVGRGAGITAVTEILAMLGIGYLLGKAFGWSDMDSVFLGGMLSISSTTIIIRAFDEMGFRQRRFVQLVFGVLIVEDLIAIVLLVLLSTLAVSHAFEGLHLLKEVGRLGFFLTLWFVGGIFLVPWFLRQTRHLMNAETSLVVALGLCLLMVVLATRLGFSPALGAFIMGSIFAETSDGEKIEHHLRPVRDLFAAIFFVSIGMLIEIKTLQDHWLAVVIISLVTIFGKLLSTFLGALFSGQSLRHSVQAGMSLAQIGEFSFLIATLGLSLQVTSDFLYPIAVAVSAITTFTTPYMIRQADFVFSRIDRALPVDWRNRLETRAQAFSPSSSLGETSHSILRMFVNSVLVIAIALASSRWFQPFWVAIFGSSALSNYMALACAVLLSLPFLWAIFSPSSLVARGLPSKEELERHTTRALFSLMGRFLWSFTLLGFVIAQFTPAMTSVAVIGVLTVFVGFLGFRNFSRLYGWLENRFLSHLNEKEIEKLKTSQPKPALAPWDAHLAELRVDPDSMAVGMSLAELGLREKMGITIALIERGRRQILAPKKDALLMAHDRLSVIGTDEQIAALASVLVAPDPALSEPNLHFGLDHVVLSASSPFVGKTIRDCGVREIVDGLIVGIERAGERILNPESSLELKSDDCLWIVGNRDQISKLYLTSR
ncbi:MAG: cation:proton antiporter, partial [Bdellovibrio sp.]